MLLSLACLLALLPLVDCCFPTFLKFGHHYWQCRCCLQQCCHCIVCAKFWCCCCLVECFLFIFINLASLAVWQVLLESCCHCCSFAFANCKLLHRNTRSVQCHCCSIMMLFLAINHLEKACSSLVSWLLGLSLGVAACCNERCCF